MKTVNIPSRQDVSPSDCWDLSTLYSDDAAWESDYAKLENRIGHYSSFQGKIGSDAKSLADFLVFDREIERQSERLGTYAFLRTAEDQSNQAAQALVAKFQNLSVRTNQLAAYFRPELLAIPTERMNVLLAADELDEFRLVLERIIRYREHTLSDGEERLLAMQGEMAQTASKAFRQLTDADLRFGLVTNEHGQQVELSNATFSQLLKSPVREVRKTAFHQYYAQFEGHVNTLSATLAGSIHTDVYYAKARRYSTSLSAALFPDNVPAEVYENLIAAVRNQLPAIYRYFELRKRYMKLEQIHHYDTYVPLLSELDQQRSWDEAVETIMDSLRPLGSEYCDVLAKGLRGRWCDRYPNKGKQSGAFSCGSFDGAPYILMNYQPQVLNDLFTLAHEAGHSMHSYLSAKHQPFQYYNYTIFVAEVASTVNEQLLTQHLLSNSRDDRLRAYLLNHEVDSIRATIVRQTMFAEFEKQTHAMAEAGEPLTVETIKAVYSMLLASYFGPNFTIDPELHLECFRIPHFYRGFYVYKYATGLSAAIALSRGLLNGGASEREKYLQFLQSGCRKDPLDLLRDAGVDMSSPAPVATALNRFSELVDELESLLVH
jgi:oligoendopeptidase F